MTIATNLAIDDELIEEARKIGEHDTKEAAVTAALLEYIQKRKQLNILELFGKIKYAPRCNYKKQKKRSKNHYG